MTDAELRAFKLTEPLDVLHQRSIERLYGLEGPAILEVLRFVCIPCQTRVLCRFWGCLCLRVALVQANQASNKDTPVCWGGGGR